MKRRKGLYFFGMLIGVFLIFASNASVVSGMDWSKVTLSPTGEDLEGVTFGNNLIVAVGDNGTIVTSSDGVVWESPDSGTNKELRGVARGDGMFVAVGNDGTIVTKSDDGVWTLLDSVTEHRLRGVTWTGSQFIAVGNMGTIVTSEPDTWSVVNPTDEDLNGVTFGNGLVVAVGDNGTIFTKLNDGDWTSQISDTPRDLEDVAWRAGMFVAVGNEGTILTSTDGELWESQGFVTVQKFKAVTWGGTQFVAVGDAGVIFTSPNGKVWNSHDSGTDLDLEGVTWSGTQFVAVGDFGTILTRLVSEPDIAVFDEVDPVDDQKIPFGDVGIDFTSKKTITIANTGNANLIIGTIASTNALADPFSITGDGCSGEILAPADTCTLTVEFAPMGTGTVDDTFDIPSNDPDENPVTIGVSGTGVEGAVPDITVTDSVGLLNDLTISFEDVAIGNPQEGTVTITNDGSAELVIGTIAFDGPSGPFSLSVADCSERTLTTTAPENTCTLTVRFDPTATGPFNGTFDIPSNDPDEGLITVDVSGTGLPGGEGVNNPPSAPQLIFPVNGQTDVGTDVTFRWLESTDPDGDDITYTLSICKNADFTGPDCGPTPVTFLGKPALFFAALGGSSAGLLLFGFVLIGGVQGRKTGLLIAMFIVTGMLLTACSSGNGGIGAGAPAVVTQDMEGLASDTTFFWKVTAKDEPVGTADSLTTDSETWSFTTTP